MEIMGHQGKRPGFDASLCKFFDSVNTRSLYPSFISSSVTWECAISLAELRGGVNELMFIAFLDQAPALYRPGIKTCAALRATGTELPPAELCLFGGKTALDDLQINERDCVPIKLYL